MVNHVGKLPGDFLRLSKQKIENVNAMRRDVEQRSAAGFEGIEQPAAVAGAVKPHVIREFGEYRPADCSGRKQFASAPNFWVKPAVVGDTEFLSALLRFPHHGRRFGFVHRHRFFREHMLARAERLNRLRRMQENRRADVYRINCRIREGFVKGPPGDGLVGSGFRRVARNQPIQSAARFGLNGWNNAADGDVTDADDDPVHKRGFEVSELQRSQTCSSDRASKNNPTKKLKGRTEPAFPMILWSHLLLGAMAS